MASTSSGLSSLGEREKEGEDEKKKNEGKKKRKTVGEKKQKKREIAGEGVNGERLHALQSLAWTALTSIKQREHLDFLTSDSSFSSSSSVSSSSYPHRNEGPHTDRIDKQSGQSDREVAREEEQKRKKKVGEKEKRREEEEEDELQQGKKREKEKDWSSVKRSDRMNDDLQEELRSLLLPKEEEEEKYKEAVFSLLKEFPGEEDPKNSEMPSGREQQMKLLVLLSTVSKGSRCQVYIHSSNSVRIDEQEKNTDVFCDVYIYAR